MKKKSCRILGALCAACLMMGCGSSVGEIAPKDMREDAETVRVMTYNVCGWDYKNIQNLVPKLILEYSPDLAGMQECTYDWYKKFTKEMPEYGFIGVGRDTGDMNFEKNSEYYNVITDAGFLDAQDLAADTMDGITCPTERGGTIGEHIDYVFFNEKITKVLTYKILRDSYEGKYPSDHYAIYVDFKFQ